MSKNRMHRIFILIVLIITALPFAARAFALSPMFFDPSFAQVVEERVREVADREGWLLSDMELRRVGRESVTLLHRQHIRGPDPTACFMLSLADGALTPCAST